MKPCVRNVFIKKGLGGCKTYMEEQPAGPAAAIEQERIQGLMPAVPEEPAASALLVVSAKTAVARRARARIDLGNIVRKRG